MLHLQDGRCSICNNIFPVTRRKGRRYCVDHHWKTLKTRGLLCSNDNTMLGMAKEKPIRLVRGAMYLIKNALRHGYEAQLDPNLERKDWQNVYMDLYKIQKKLEV